MTKQYIENKKEYFYFVFRIIIGFLFLLHGMSKVQGIYSGNMSLWGLMTLAAAIETIGGLFLIIGLLTRYVAAISAIEMVFAYFMAHASKGLNPLVNKGETAILFFAAFLVIMTFGAKKWAIDNLFKK